MADSLTNHALWLNAAQRHDEALTTAAEALTMFQTNPTRFAPRLTQAVEIHRVIRDS